MTLPTSQITTTLVAETLKTSSRDVGTLCTDTNINKWAKFKPTCYYQTVEGSPLDLCKAKYNNIDGIGVYGNHFNGDYGIAPTYKEAVIYNNEDRAQQIKESCNYDWHYQHPTGGANFPYRLGDFRRYDTEAKPFLFLSGNKFTVNLLESDTFSFTFNHTESGDHFGWVCADNIIGSQEIDFQYCKIEGVLFRGNTLIDIADSEYIIDNDGNVITPTITFDLSNLQQGVYDLKAYFALVQMRMDGASTNYIYNLPQPDDSQTSPLPATLTVTFDRADQGLGINVDKIYIKPGLVTGSNTTTPNKLLKDCCEIAGSDPQYYMTHGDGHVSFKITFNNTSDNDITWSADDFAISTDEYENKTAYQIRNEDGTAIASNSFVSPAKGEVTIWILFEDALSLIPSGSPAGSGEEITFKLYGTSNNWEIFSGYLYHQMGNNGFVEIN